MQIDLFSEGQPRSERYAYLASIFRRPDSSGAFISSTAHPDLASAYWRLFLGPGRPVVQPYESVYIEGKLLGEVCEILLQRYSEAGLQPKINDVHLPDHISVELAFMAFLADQENEHSSRSVIWRARQQRFLKQHLNLWATAFCTGVQESQMHPFFSQAARALQELIRQDLERLVNHRETRKYPKVHLEVESSCCTLCMLCVDNCRQGALSASCSLETLNLIFEAARCNGCRACLRLCPEGAIKLEKLPAEELGQPGNRTLASAMRVVCPSCGQPHIATPWLNKLAARLGDEPAMRASLMLCPVCKTYSGQDIPTQIVVS